MGLKIAEPLTLNCGLTVSNRLAKAAMSEQWADKNKLPDNGLIKAFGIWADGGWGITMTGNVFVDSKYLGMKTDVSINNDISRDRQLAAWTEWAKAAGKNGTAPIMQINHPGRQSLPGAGTHGYFGKNIAPSPIPVNMGNGIIAKILAALMYGTPKEMTIEDIQHVIDCFANTAKLASDAGFAGVEIHGAHGYLLTQFLTAKTNRRTDAYGGTPKKRARIVIEILHAIRKVVPTSFCVGIKLNSVDHQSKKDFDECIEQLDDIAAAGIDFLEISGGSHEELSMITGGQANTIKSERTVAREAFFLDFARAIRGRFRNVPLMVTGGFRTRQGMEAALREGVCDLIGIGRPAALDPFLPMNTLFNDELSDKDAKLYTKSIPPSRLSRMLRVKAINGADETIWYMEQIHKMIS